MTAESGAEGATSNGDRPGARSPARTIFFGSGGFGRPILDVLLASPEVDVVAVVSAPDRPVGRRQEPTAVPVAARARELGLPLIQPPRLRSPDGVAAVAEAAPDLGVLADYGQIVPASVLDVPRHGILNVHPSLLPRHRGASPIPATILAGDRKTGVTLIRMDEGLDSGPIVSTQGWPLRGDETAPELESLAADAGAALLARSLGPWIRGELAATPQDEAAATMTRPLRREDGRLDAARPAAELARQVRAYVPWPGSFIETDAGRLIVHRATAVGGPPDDAGQAPPGTIGDGPDLRLATGDGWLRLDEVRPAGGRPMPGSALLVGRPGLVGSRVR